MIKYKDECIGCPPEKGCLGNSCPNIHIPYHICDDCGEEDESIYEYEGQELCLSCLLDKLDKVN